MNVRAAAEQVAKLAPQARVEWMVRMRALGNEYFKRRRYSEAVDMYIQALVGLDLNDPDPEKRRAMARDHQVPLLLNMATALLKHGKADRAMAIAAEVCTRALGLQARPWLA